MSQLVWSPALHDAIKMYKLQGMKEDFVGKLKELGLMTQEKEAVKGLVNRPLKSEDGSGLDAWY